MCALRPLLARTPTLRGRLLLFAGLAALGLTAVVGLWWSGIGGRLMSDFQSTTLWAAGPERAENVRYYHQTLNKQLGLLWSLFPIAAVIAVVNRGKPMLFAALFVAVTLGVHSLAAQKDERYVFYILPFIAVLLGVGLVPVIGAFYPGRREHAFCIRK
jgi:hypothetical protein